MFLLIFTDSHIGATGTFRASDPPSRSVFAVRLLSAPPTSDLHERCRKANTPSWQHVCTWFLPSDVNSLESQNDLLLLNKTSRITGDVTKYLHNNSSLTFILLILTVLGIYTIQISPNRSSPRVLLVQMVSTTGMALKDDIMARWQHGRLPSCGWAGPVGPALSGDQGWPLWWKIWQMFKPACLSLPIKGVHVTSSQIANVFWGTDQVALLQNSSTLGELS